MIVILLSDTTCRRRRSNFHANVATELPKRLLTGISWAAGDHRGSIAQGRRHAIGAVCGQPAAGTAHQRKECRRHRGWFVAHLSDWMKRGKPWPSEWWAVVRLPDDCACDRTEYARATGKAFALAGQRGEPACGFRSAPHARADDLFNPTDNAINYHKISRRAL